MSIEIMATSFNTESEAALFLANEWLTGGGTNSRETVSEMSLDDCLADPDFCFNDTRVDRGMLQEATRLILIAASLAQRHIEAAAAEGWDAAGGDVDEGDWNWHTHFSGGRHYTTDDLKRHVRAWLR